MEISYLGHAAFKIKTKNQTLVTDPYGEKVGKFPKDTEAAIVTVSHSHFDHNDTSRVNGEAGKEPFIIEGPGEYEIGGVSVIGIQTWHDDKEGEERGSNTVYVIEAEGLRVVHLGDLGHKLTTEQTEEIGAVDIVMVPVGGKYTIDAKTAGEVIKQLDPYIAIPMHYSMPGMAVEGLAPVDSFLKEMGKPETAAIPKLIMSADKLPEEMQIVVLEKR